MYQSTLSVKSPLLQLFSHRPKSPTQPAQITELAAIGECNAPDKMFEEETIIFLDG